MDDVWLCVEEESTSSHSSIYSDNVDTETEAELYGMIHYQENLSHVNNPNENNITNLQTSQIGDEINDISCNEAEKIETNFISSCEFSSSTSTLTNPKEIFYNLDKNSSQQNVHKFSMPPKRKSDSEQDSESVILCSEDTEAKDSSYLSKSIPTLNNKQNKKIRSSSQTTAVLKQKKVAAPVSSDSDDSVLWTEPNNSIKSDLKMNLFNDVDTISISSNSSDDSLILSSPFRRNDPDWKNLSLPNIKLGENSKDPWHINAEDLYRSNKKTRRYHENSDAQCCNCGKKGHSSKFCPVPKAIKCFYCGGGHAASYCKKKICSKCYNNGHLTRRCYLNFVNYCLHCNMKGHIQKDCPDIWRRYHLTTEPVKIVPGKPVNQDRTLYCFNCGWPGHFGAQCKEPRVVRDSFPTWPSVISYSNPDELLAKRVGNKRDINSNFTRNTRQIQGEQPNAALDFIAERRNAHQSQHFSTVQNFIAEGKRNSQDEQMNAVQDFLAKKKSPKKKLKNHMKWQLFKQRQIEINEQKKVTLREKDFPRTPKKVPNNQDATDEMPESVNLTLLQQLKRKKRRQRQKWRKFQHKKNLQGENSLNGTL